MTIKQLSRITPWFGLSGLICWVAIAPASLANPMANPMVNPTTEHLARTQATRTQANSSSSSSSTLRQGIPGRRVGGGTRNDLLFVNAFDSLAALAPTDSLIITTASHPKLLFYVPEMISDNTVEFVLRDRQDNLVYEKTFSLTREAGIVSVDLAESGVSALNLNEDYQWYFSIVPNALDRANDVVVHGGLNRVDSAEWLAHQPAGMALSEQLATAEPLEKAKILYQQANLWHDAALLLNSLHQAEPGNTLIAAEWHQLLQSTGLQNQEPMSCSNLFFYCSNHS
jgi:Domain of Unknown Function (DUF928)